MLRSIIISPDALLSEELQDLVSRVPGIGVVRWLDHYPNSVDLGRTLRVHSPQVIFLGLQNMDAALATASLIEPMVSGVQVVAFGSGANPQLRLALMRVDVREHFEAPFDALALASTIARVKENLDRTPPRPTDSEYVYSFLPAKPGAGTSTTAMNSAWACSRLSNTRALLIDLDLNSGMQRFMLKLDNAYSIVDAAENAFRLNDTLWPQLVTTIGTLDVLHAGRLNPGYRIEGSQIRSIVNFARRNYQTVCVDLSGNMERYSIEMMQESRQVFLVTTAEIASLHLARERYQYLRQLDLGDRIRLILNRSQKRAPISVRQIEDLLGLPVAAAIPNDYLGVSRALTAGKPAESKSELGQEFHRIACQMMDRQPVKGVTDEVKSIGAYFSLLPAKSALFASKKAD